MSLLRTTLLPGTQHSRYLLAHGQHGSISQHKQWSQQPQPRRSQIQFAASACEPGGSADAEARKRAEAAFLKLTEPSKVGSEYGEGFIQYRVNGEPLSLDVDTLNERLKSSGAARMRQFMRPDEAYGMIFNWDGAASGLVGRPGRLHVLFGWYTHQSLEQQIIFLVIVNTRQVQRDAWRRLAKEENLPFPSIMPQIYDIRPERAITEVLCWTRDWGQAQRWAWKVATHYADGFMAMTEPLPGVREWLAALSRANVPCAVVSTMDRMSVHAVVERMGLRHLFKASVTAEDGMETLSQNFLSAALKLGRAPNHCVVFDAFPSGVTAAHNCTMRAVAVLGAHRSYQLQQADLTCLSMSELSVYNVRRLFANHGQETEFMDRQHQTSPGSQGRPKQRRTTNATVQPD